MEYGQKVERSNESFWMRTMCFRSLTLMSAAAVRGIQSQRVAATIQHFVYNDQEHQHMAVDSLVTDTALREICLKAVQIAQRDARPLVYTTGNVDYGRKGLRCVDWE